MTTSHRQTQECAAHLHAVIDVGHAKLYSYWMVVNYRESYGIHARNTILFNHESPRRETFVTRKTTRGIANIVAGKQTKISLENLEARRDWGYAPEYVESMYGMLQSDEPGDFVVGVGAFPEDET